MGGTVVVDVLAGSEPFYNNPKAGYKINQYNIASKQLPALKDGVCPLFYVSESMQEMAWDLVFQIYRYELWADDIVRILKAGVNEYHNPAYVYCVDGEIRGFLRGCVHSANGSAEISQVYVHPDFQKKHKMGTQLVGAFTAYSQHIGAGRLLVTSLNDAIGFYRDGLQFQQVSGQSNKFFKTL